MTVGFVGYRLQINIHWAFQSDPAEGGKIDCVYSEKDEYLTTSTGIGFSRTEEIFFSIINYLTFAALPERFMH